MIDGAAVGVATDTDGAGDFEEAGNQELSIAEFELAPSTAGARPVATPSGRFIDRARRDLRLGARAPDMVALNMGYGDDLRKAKRQHVMLCIRCSRETAGNGIHTF